MENFTYYTPCKVHFGKGQISKLGESLKKYGNNVLLVYGGGSIKKTGLYDTVKEIVAKDGLSMVEISGVEPNPKVTTVVKGADLCRAHKVDVILAVGGGSVIDCAKGIAASSRYDGDPWDIVIGKHPVLDAIPIVVITTMAGTATEMNPGAVISNPATKEKKSFVSELVTPKVVIMDPEYLYTVPLRQKACGVADAMIHAMEAYFNHTPGTYFQGQVCLSVIKTMVKYGKKLLDEPEDYTTNAEILWASNWANNGLAIMGAPVTWSCHSLEHQLSAVYDVVHGEGLAVIVPAWMRFAMKNEKTWAKFVEFGTEVWDIDPTLDVQEILKLTVEKTEQFLYEDLKLPRTLREIGITDQDQFEFMAGRTGVGREKAFAPYDKAGALEIYRDCF